MNKFVKYIVFLLHRYLYTDDVTINGGNVTGMLYLSKKYDVKTLEKRCVSYLTSSLTSQDACLIMEEAHRYDEHGLKGEALTFIWEHGDEVLKSGGVADLCHECLVRVIQPDDLKADEEKVFESALVWSEKACTKQRREITPENQRKFLGEAIMHVRYPLLGLKYFIKKVSPTKLLSESEENKIFRHLGCPDENVSPFNAKPRSSVIPKQHVTITQPTSSVIPKQRVTVTRLSDTYYGVLECSGDVDDGIMFRVNQTASMLGFQLYGFGGETYSIRACLSKASTDEVMEGSSIEKTCTGIDGQYKYDVEFARPVQLTKDENYCLTVNIKGPGSGYGKKGQSTVQHGSFVCSFFNCQKTRWGKNNRTTVEQGQIPGLIFLI